MSNLVRHFFFSHQQMSDTAVVFRLTAQMLLAKWRIDMPTTVEFILGDCSEPGGRDATLRPPQEETRLHSWINSRLQESRCTVFRDGPSVTCNPWLFDFLYLRIKPPFQAFNPFNLRAAQLGWAWYYSLCSFQAWASSDFTRGMEPFEYPTWLSTAGGEEQGRWWKAPPVRQNVEGEKSRRPADFYQLIAHVLLKPSGVNN